MKAATQCCIQLNGREVNYRLIRSKAARTLRVRIGPAGVVSRAAGHSKNQ